MISLAYYIDERRAEIKMIRKMIRRKKMEKKYDIDLRCFCKNCEARTKETYRLTVKCFNCGWKGIALLRKGDKPGFMEDCPHCGVRRLDFGDSPDISVSKNESP